jgi:dTDP-4-amino-4,6-dideoxygalactose transaminase
MEAYKYLNHDKSEFPVADELQHQILSLPMYPELTYDMMDYIATAIKDFYKA